MLSAVDRNTNARSPVPPGASAAVPPLPPPSAPSASPPVQPSTHPSIHDSAEPATAAALTPIETEVIEVFVQLSRLLGQPRSLAEIYGLLFISVQPLAMDDLIRRLRLSKGSASQGLKFLRNIGAVRMVYVAGDRRTHYEAVAELRKLAGRFLREHIVPHLDHGLKRLDGLSRLVEQMPAPARQRVAGRVKMLQSWEKNGRRVLPLVAKVLGK
jgi:DNA-binding transcriptional regulator GbsR (MarR family)